MYTYMHTHGCSHLKTAPAHSQSAPASFPVSMAGSRSVSEAQYWPNVYTTLADREVARSLQTAQRTLRRLDATEAARQRAQTLEPG